MDHLAQQVVAFAGGDSPFRLLALFSFGVAVYLIALGAWRMGKGQGMRKGVADMLSGLICALVAVNAVLAGINFHSSVIDGLMLLLIVLLTVSIWGVTTSNRHEASDRQG